MEDRGNQKAGGNDKQQKVHQGSEGRRGAENKVKRQEGKEGTQNGDGNEITTINRRTEDRR